MSASAILIDMVYPLAKHFVLPPVRLWVREIKGVENLPREQGFIITANHSSYLDHWGLGYPVVYCLNKKLHFLAKKEHFDNLFERIWHTYAGAIPLDREAGGKEALKRAIESLKEGKVIGIYPEGTRSLTGKMQRAKTGIARLALEAKVPVVPVGLIGMFGILPKGRWVPRFKTAKVAIGKPMSFEKHYGKPITKRLLREITTTIMKEIARLSHQRYDFD